MRALSCDSAITFSAFAIAYEKSDVSLFSRALARKSEPYEWINETRIEPWVIYVLKKKEYDLLQIQKHKQ
jgi:hypothetical protein